MEKNTIIRIQKAIDYIEDNLYENINIENIVKSTFMSKSSFYILFSDVLGTTVKDYIRKRRLSLSAYDLIYTDLNILDIAIKYQYNAYESYSRTFKKLFGVSPKKYREKNLYTNVFPRILLSYYNLLGGDKMINKEMNKEVIFQKLKNIAKGYILDIDIDHFENINQNYGYKIGDKVLIEVSQRINNLLKNYNLNTDVIRINADEFAVILKDKSIEFIQKLSKDIIESMKNDFVFEDTSLNLTVSIGISDFTVEKESEKVIQDVKEAMLSAKRNGKNQFKMA
ncbi:diguanylate cyclase [Clostridium sp. D2Q-11]|uniref:Diguanylate cyclase n=1 Tax=Anaeromonas frigoriresistens TaxID=2683708 RepID=A0A942UWV4_9FIRM|nr:diguanylate cyclase [Anaeromonas frigoriresistens]MBS4539035.1 diguanylate cyclase [Anaeromonas frigoriresistens]